MELKLQDILFSPLEVGEIDDFTHLRKSYSSYKSAFNHIAENTYSAFLDIENRNRNLAEVLSQVFSYSSTKKGEDWKVLLNRYTEFIGQFEKFIDRNVGVNNALKGRGLHLLNFEEWKDRVMSYSSSLRPDREESIRDYLQLMADTKETVSCLWSVYEHFCIQSMTTSFAYDGCVHLGVTWKDYFSTLAKTAMGVIQHPIYDMLAIVHKCQTVFKKYHQTVFDIIERDGAAFADFPYTFDHKSSLNPVSIKPLVLNGHADDRILEAYVYKDGKLELNDSDGMAVALFDYRYDMGATAHCISFAGTRLKASNPHKAKVMAQNVITDAYQFVCGASKVYYAAVGILLAVMRTYPGEKILVFGHSLGGGLMQFACSAVNSQDVAGYGYNSAGLSWYNMRLIAQKIGGNNLQSDIEHICAQHDPISFWGHQIGEVKYIKSGNTLTAHCLSGLNKRLNKGRELKVWF